MSANMTTPASALQANITGNNSANDTSHGYRLNMWANYPAVPPLLTFLWAVLMIVGVVGNLGFIYVPGEIRNLYYYADDSLWLNKGYCIVMNTISSPCQYASLFTMTVIAFERYFAICRPFKMSGVTNKKGRAFRFIAFIWIMGIIVSVPTYLTCNQNISQSQNKNLLIALFVIRLITFVPSMVLVAVLYIQVGRALTERTNKGSGKDEQVRNERKQVVRMLVVTAVVFFLCMIPTQVYTLITTMSVFGITKYPTFNVGLSMFAINKTLMYINSAANPIIYNAMSSKYRVAFKEALGPLCCCVEQRSKQKYYYDTSNHTMVTM
uniref:Neuropeptides capa receptor-like n=1 Tax=Saccoglossus kowalevskii TaxID=10224 RepID=A0ABM0MQD5_SACKO|nr:PREDICTED: neuropeptides capa receptor-like [Saccoglossus kowalevskii]